MKRFFKLGNFLKNKKKPIFITIFISITLLFVTLGIGKAYQHWDNDPDRGAIAISNGAFGENYSTPTYLNQGWSAADSLWFYNTTQGSALLPYDFYLNLEIADSSELVRANSTVDKYRYLPQKPTFFNPDGLAVGFVKDSYQGKDYMGYTCAACHTTQVNYQGQAIRIDGGPAMANMVGYLKEIEKGLKQTLSDPEKQTRFIQSVLELDNDFNDEKEVKKELLKWTNTISLYNTVNHSHLDYGYGRMDAFGRIYNRVLQYVLNRQQVFNLLTQITSSPGNYMVTSEQAKKVLQGINETIIDDEQFSLILKRLLSKEAGYPGLSNKNILMVRNAFFNEPDAPVSYPFLWDIAQSDYVQWNGVASNAGVGPLGRNTGEVIGVFGKLDWQAKSKRSISSYLTDQDSKKKKVDFQSSINLVNLQRIESHLQSLQSPQWPAEIFGHIDIEKSDRGRKIYAQYCQSCHEIIDRDNHDRIVIGKFSAIEHVGTDPTMAKNSVTYTGNSGNFKHTYQATDVGDVIIEGQAPVVQILTSVTKGVVATPDPDKWFVRRWADWFYTLGSSFFDNPIKASIKAGNYNADTTASPYQSLLSYKARSLNGIWATAPYLHNGSVPTLYDLLLPSKKEGDPEMGQYRPETFKVGSREYDPIKLGFLSQAYDGSKYSTLNVGNLNSGHEYAAGRTAQIDGTVLAALNEDQRWDLIEFIKTL